MRRRVSESAKQDDVLPRSELDEVGVVHDCTHRQVQVSVVFQTQTTQITQ